MPNLFIVLVLFIGLFASRTMGTVYGIIIGLILDLVLGNKVGVNAVTLGIIGFLAGVFDKNFSKDSRMTIMLMTISATLLVEGANYLIKYVLLSVLSINSKSSGNVCSRAASRTVIVRACAGSG